MKSKTIPLSAFTVFLICKTKRWAELFVSGWPEKAPKRSHNRRRSSPRPLLFGRKGQRSGSANKSRGNIIHRMQIHFFPHPKETSKSAFTNGARILRNKCEPLFSDREPRALFLRPFEFSGIAGEGKRGAREWKGGSVGICSFYF